MAAFYEKRAYAVASLAAGEYGNDYLDNQRIAMQPMFAALLSRGYAMTPLQLDIASEYIAAAKVGMICLWLQRNRKIGLSQINKMSETIVESDLWEFVARQAPAYGRPHPKRELCNLPFEYPWMRENS